MFPDYPKAKKFIHQLDFKRLLAGRDEAMGFLSELPQNPIHEGHRSAFIRPDGKFDETKFEKVEVKMNISEEDLEKWTDEQIDEYYQKIGREFAEKQSKMTFKQMDETISGVGNEIRIKGPPTAEAILAMYEKIEIDFEPDGRHVPLTLVCSPEGAPAYEKAHRDLHEVPEFRKRFNDVLAEKRRQWHEREASRKLVG